jgi:uncharacterized protein
MDYIYLHGFASSPRSAKARDLAARFAALGIPLQTPDLNWPDFTHLTLTRQIQQVSARFRPNVPVTLIGSSFGGLTAAWLGQQFPQVARLVLLAPAFDFLRYWLPSLPTETLERWQAGDPLSVYHHGDRCQRLIDYGCVRDLAQYDEAQLQRPVPTLILHGQGDETIPIGASRDYGADRAWVQLIELESDHSLNNVSDLIWRAMVPLWGQLAPQKSAPNHISERF